MRDDCVFCHGNLPLTTLESCFSSCFISLADSAFSQADSFASELTTIIPLDDCALAATDALSKFARHWFISRTDKQDMLIFKSSRCFSTAIHFNNQNLNDGFRLCIKCSMGTCKKRAEGAKETEKRGDENKRAEPFSFIVKNLYDFKTPIYLWMCISGERWNEAAGTSDARMQLKSWRRDRRWHRWNGLRAAFWKANENISRARWI